MSPPVCAISLRSHNVNVIIVKSIEEGLVVPEQNDFCLNLVLIQICAQHTRHGAVEDADLFPIQRRGDDSYILVSVMLDEIITDTRS